MLRVSYTVETMSPVIGDRAHARCSSSIPLPNQTLVTHMDGDTDREWVQLRLFYDSSEYKRRTVTNKSFIPGYTSNTA